jgi:tetratricopeptide (TPR) repeat protein
MRINKIPNYILIIFLGLTSFIIYANSLHGEFLIDDTKAFLSNERVHSLKDFLAKDFKDISPGVLWRLTYVFNWHISGTNPYSYHLFNVLTNSACVILFFILCNILFKNRILSALASLIFAVHPIHAEAVSWISAGHYVFSSLFFISSMIFYVKSGRSITNFILSLILFTLGLFAGNANFTLPLVFIVYELFFREKTIGMRPSFAFRITTFSLIILVSALFMAAAFIERSWYAQHIFSYRGPAYLIVALKQIVYYLKILYIPMQRGLYHPFGYSVANLQKISPAFFGSLLIISASIFLFFVCRRKHPPVSFGIAWFFIAYLLYSNIIPVCNIISERYLYLASAGFCLILAYTFLKVWETINSHIQHRRFYRSLAVIAITIFLSSYALLTIKHNYDFNNIFTFWDSNINNFPEGYRAYNSLAGTFYAQGNLEQSIAYCWVNLMIKPDQPHVWCNLGRAYQTKGDLKQAGLCYKKALEIERDYAAARRGLEDLDKLLRKKSSPNKK